MLMEITEVLLRSLISDQSKSLSEVARITGKNVGFISRKAKQYGMVSKHLNKAANKKLPIESIYNRYINGESLHSLKIEYGTSVQCIKRNLKKKYPDIVFRSMDQAKRPDQLNDPNFLIECAENNKTVSDIAKELGVKHATVLAAYGRMEIDRYLPDKLFISKSDLNDLYWNKRKSSIDIGDMFGVSASSIINLLKRYGIAVRGFRENAPSKHSELNEKIWLEDQYINLERSMQDIANEIGTSIGNVSHHLKKHGIPIRTKAEVCEINDGLAIKTEFCFNGTVIKCDSLLETAYLRTLSEYDIVSRASKIQWGDLIYIPDFIVNGNLTEVKSKSESVNPGIDRQRLIKQLMIADKCDKKVIVWNGKPIDIVVEDEDIYFAANWKLFFDTPDDCYNWLLRYGFKGVKFTRGKMIRALSKVKFYDHDPNKGLNSNLPSVETLKLLIHFNDHYYRSSHKDYNPISAAWEIGNHSVLKNAINRIWSDSRDINIYGLVKTIGKWYKDFSPVSIFKPWVASYIYNRYLPNGGVVVDPCMGWGGRLLGCLEKNISYHGYDLNPNAVESHHNLRKFLGGRLGETSFMNADSSSVEFPNCDLMFTSPPYDDTEHYYGIDSSKTITKPILDNIFSSGNKLIVLNLPKRQEDLCRACAIEHGYRLQERLEMKTSSFMGREKTCEPILAFNNVC